MVIRTRMTTLFDPSSVAPYGSETWALECKKKLEEALDRAFGGKLEFDRDVRQFWEHQGWKALKNGDGQTFASFREFALADRPYGLHIPTRAYKGLMQDIDKAMAEVIEVAEVQTLRPHGRPSKDHETDKGSVRTFSRGETADYLARRIARDRPDILAKMKAGDYKSVRAAAKDAGIVKEQTPLQRVQSAWKHASHDDKAHIINWVQDQLQEDADLLGYLGHFHHVNHDE